MNLAKKLMGVGSGFIADPGQVAFTTPGTYSWDVPEGVTSVSVVCVGAGASILGFSGAEGTPSAPGTSSFNDEVFAFCSSGRTGGGYSGADGGGVGGTGGAEASNDTDIGGGGGGGAGGYSGNGGNGGTGRAGSQDVSRDGGGGGGVGLMGEGSPGLGGTVGRSGNTGNGGGGGGGAGGDAATVTTGGQGQGGSGGLPVSSNFNTPPNSRIGGNYGGGRGGSLTSSYNGTGGGGLAYKNNIPVTGGQTISIKVGDSWLAGTGAVRIIWPGNQRQFPSTRTADE